MSAGSAIRCVYEREWLERDYLMLRERFSPVQQVIIREVAGGKMSELIERVAFLKKSQMTFCIVTVVESAGATPRKAGARAIIFPDRSLEGTVGGGAIEQEAISVALAVLADKKPCLKRYDLDALETDAMICGGAMTLYFEPVLPDRLLTIFGGGHVGRALARVAHEAGWLIRVVDEREGIFETNLFPERSQLIREPFAEFIDRNEFGQNDWIAIVTPKHKNDEQVLEGVIHSSAAYIGMMGSPKKVKETMANLLQKGIPQSLLDAVYAPVGLNIATETPGEIAVSIVAEMLAILHRIPAIKSFSRRQDIAFNEKDQSHA
ncbi:MAG: XdhC family protein [Candidatus Zhuqueibacterota bacterium]